MTRYIDPKSIAYVKKRHKKNKHKKALVSLAIVFSIICNMFTSFIISAFASNVTQAERLRQNGGLFGTIAGSLLGADLLAGKSIAERLDESDSALSTITEKFLSWTADNSSLFGPLEAPASELFFKQDWVSPLKEGINSVFEAHNEEDTGLSGFTPYKFDDNVSYTISITDLKNVSGSSTGYNAKYELSLYGNQYYYLFFNNITSYLDYSSSPFVLSASASVSNPYIGLSNSVLCARFAYGSNNYMPSLISFSDDFVSTFYYDNVNGIYPNKYAFTVYFNYGNNNYSFDFSVINPNSSNYPYGAPVSFNDVSYYISSVNASLISGNTTDYHGIASICLAWLIWSGHIGDYTPEETDTSLKDTSRIINYNDWYNDYGTVNNIYYGSTTGDYLSTYNDSFTDLWGVAEDLLEEYTDPDVSILSGARINLDKLIDTLNANFDMDISPTKYYDSETGEEGGTTDGYSYAVETALKKIDEDLLSFKDYIEALDLTPVVYKDSDGNVVDEPTVQEITEGDVNTYYITYDSGSGTSTIGDIAEDLIVDELNKLKTNVSSLFPFCLVFLLLDFFDVFIADPEAPEISIDTANIFSTHGVTVSTDYAVSESFIMYQDGILTISLAPYNTLSTICRASSLILFCVALVFVTKKLLFSSGD